MRPLATTVLIALVTASAHATYVFDRATGRPVWPIEERPVPQSTVPGEKTAATQPFPTKPPAFARQGISEDDLIDFTPALKAEAKRMLAEYTYGPLFTPPTIAGENGKRGTLIQPGAAGGANWGGAGFDPDTGFLFVQASNLYSLGGLVKGDAAKGQSVWIALTSSARYGWDCPNRRVLDTDQFARRRTPL